MYSERALEQKTVRLYVGEFQEKCCVNARLKSLKCQIAAAVDFSTVIKQDERFVYEAARGS